ncbi:MAG: hypothetical protein F6K41_05300 [Symploca sp. SIO3E6]|nr:hypothetical protein [Caldora sp. SIO3E6]
MGQGRQGGKVDKGEEEKRSINRAVINLSLSDDNQSSEYAEQDCSIAAQ